MMLGCLIGGPYDGYVVTTRSLPALVDGYHPTDVFVVRQDESRLARIWLHCTAVLNADRFADRGLKILSQEESKKDMTEDLEARRKDLKISRAALAERSGLTQAKIARIEKGGARTTEEEIAQLSGALDAFAAESPSAGEAEQQDPQ